MALGNMLDDGQAQTGSTGLTRTATINPIKTLGQARQVLRCNAPPRVPDLELTTPILKQNPVNLDQSTIRRIAHCIGNQIR